ncbi:MAG: hypothetical protein ABJB40_06585 [Acidobacteriota bacterium]
MHCPSCGQQQISNETKFCSRCGMPLGVVSEVLIHGGYLPQLEEINKTKETIYTRKNGIVFSLFWFIFWVPILTWMFAGVIGADTLAGITALIGVFGSLMIFIFSLVYLKKPAKMIHPAFYTQAPPPPNLYAGANPALPPQRAVPTSAYTVPQQGSWRDTNDLQATSVTEGTTKLLEKDEQP